MRVFFSQTKRCTVLDKNDFRMHKCLLRSIYGFEYVVSRKESTPDTRCASRAILLFLLGLPSYVCTNDANVLDIRCTSSGFKFVLECMCCFQTVHLHLTRYSYINCKKKTSHFFHFTQKVVPVGHRNLIIKKRTLLATHNKRPGYI